MRIAGFVNRWTLFGAVFGASLMILVGVAEAERSPRLPPEHAAGALLRTDSGRLVAICEAGDLIESEATGLEAEEDQNLRLPATAQAAMAAHLAEKKKASSAANPMLSELSKDERAAYIEFFRTHQAPIQRLELPRMSREDNLWVFEKPVAEELAKLYDADASDWVAARMEVVEIEGRGFKVVSAIYCSSELFDDVDAAIDASPALVGDNQRGEG